MVDDQTDTSLTTALRRADAAHAVEQGVKGAVEEALSTPASPIFNTHSTNYAQKMAIDAEGIVSQMAEIDAKIAILMAEKDDLLLTHSMIVAAETARRRGVPPKD